MATSESRGWSKKKQHRKNYAREFFRGHSYFTDEAYYPRSYFKELIKKGEEVLPGVVKHFSWNSKSGWNSGVASAVLNANIGEPYDVVHSEICRKLGRSDRGYFIRKCYLKLHEAIHRSIYSSHPTGLISCFDENGLYTGSVSRGKSAGAPRWTYLKDHDLFIPRGLNHRPEDKENKGLRFYYKYDQETQGWTEVLVESISSPALYYSADYLRSIHGRPVMPFPVYFRPHYSGEDDGGLLRNKPWSAFRDMAYFRDAIGFDNDAFELLFQDRAAKEELVWETHYFFKKAYDELYGYTEFLDFLFKKIHIKEHLFQLWLFKWCLDNPRKTFKKEVSRKPLSNSEGRKRRMPKHTYAVALMNG